MKQKIVMVALLALALGLVLQFTVFAVQNAQKEVKDLVCGMKGQEANFKWTSAYKGKTYNFCSEGCKQKFDKEPDKYITASQKPATVKKVAMVEKHGQDGHACDPAECQHAGMEKDCPMMKKNTEKIE